MKAIEGIYGIFLQQDTFLLLHRTPGRTMNANTWNPMGGDVKKGEDPETVFYRDAKEKLNITEITIERSRQIIVPTSEGVSRPMRRDCIVARGNCGNLVLDPTKYDGHGWFTGTTIGGLVLTPGVHFVLRTMGLIVPLQEKR
jgi:hypothetical protein